MRLIDADDLAAKIMMESPDFMNSGSTITKAFILAMVTTRSVTPTIDAVKVVQCKDCEYLIDHYGFMDDGYCRKMQEDYNAKLKPDSDFYCKYGRMKGR